ncbi:MAG: type II toxin-antitoxin system HicB family antitoxin [Acidobacteria bacterium]|nr:type II toxin-antitoxin system HicB family antitoxin [Acidobacteriota bacterium]
MCRGEDWAYEVPLVATQKAEGGYRVTSPTLPELVAEGDTREDALSSAQTALGAVLDLYEEKGKTTTVWFLAVWAQIPWQIISSGG